MSAGTDLRPCSDMGRLAPKMRAAVEAVLAACAAAGMDAVVYETMRSQELQALYYARGRQVVPPEKPVTNVRDARYGWHAYGLAVDIVSRSRGWDVPETWWTRLGNIARARGLSWGGDWKQNDRPHLQWGKCRDTPSDRARELLAEGGVEAVWKEVNAV